MGLLALLGIGSGSPVEVGAPAPDAFALDQDGKAVELKQLYGPDFTLVYFYPKASTPGCTAQACNLRDSFPKLRQRGITVLGVSHDTPGKQKTFLETEQIPFTLIADKDSNVATAFGVPSIFGITRRQSFLIKDGQVIWRDLKANPDTQSADVLRAIDDWQKSSSGPSSR